MHEAYVFERCYRRCTLRENLISPLNISYFFYILFLIRILFSIEATVIAMYVVKVTSVN